MLGFPLLYFKGMRILMFQLSGFYCRTLETAGTGLRGFALLGNGAESLKLSA